MWIKRGAILYNPDKKAFKVSCRYTLSFIPLVLQALHLYYNKDKVHGIVLDCGCGTKPFYDILADKSSRYIGFDGLCEWEKDRPIDVYGDAHKIPFADESADTILSLSVMEHLPDPETHAEEMYRVLKKGGNLLVIVPFMYGIHGVDKDFYRYTKFGLAEILRRHGFVDIQVREIGGIGSFLVDLFTKLGEYFLLAIERIFKVKIGQIVVVRYIFSIPSRIFLFFYKPIFLWVNGYGRFSSPNRGKRSMRMAEIYSKHFNTYAMNYFAVAKKA